MEGPDNGSPPDQRGYFDTHIRVVLEIKDEGTSVH